LKKKPKKPTAKERKGTLEELERAVSLLERLKGTSPELDALHARGEKILASYRASEDAVLEAQRKYEKATRELDGSVRAIFEKFGRKNLEAALAELVRTGDTKHAELLGMILEHGRKLAKRDQKKKR